MPASVQIILGQREHDINRVLCRQFNVLDQQRDVLPQTSACLGERHPVIRKAASVALWRKNLIFPDPSMVQIPP